MPTTKDLLDGGYRASYRFAWAVILAYRFVFRPTVVGAYVAVWYGERLLVIRNPHKPYHTVPCGFVNRGELPVEAAVRELAEEVGMHVSSSALRYAGVFNTSEDYASDEGHVFEMEVADLPAVSPDGREVLSAEFLTLESISRLRLSDIVRQYLVARQVGAERESSRTGAPR